MTKMKKLLQKPWAWYMSLSMVDDLMITMVVCGTIYMLGEYGFMVWKTLFQITFYPIMLTKIYLEMKDEGIF